ncbi:MAG TPA: DUF1778 domain-containing protein [Blastocatellia bacterium]|nr:DUF1778 domain-containing protein [Blastocatellia bacterium]HMX30391.1 DUF1778 domain-containing protein [Blastocatellia bacterium]HMY76402.1 DUF1778 domain-containing protein [Blastocatellia bacterium]HMZ22680.1 DUF1778 domain-containing protein [Blastocatellia bacterium]
MQSQASQLTLSLSPTLSALLTKAARLRNASLNEFALTALENAAQATVEDTNLIELSVRDRDLFLAALDEDSEPNEALLRAMKRHRQMIQP